MFVDCDAARRHGEVASVPQLNAPDWDPPEGGGVLSKSTDLYKLGLFVLRCLTPDAMCSVNRDPSKARYVLDPTGLALLQAAIGGLPDRRTTAHQWVRYLTTANEAGNAAPTKVPKSRSGPLLRLFQELLIFSLVAGAGLFEYQTGWAESALVRGGGVTGSVRPETEWNLRTGPSVRLAIVGQVKPGDSVTVACLHNGRAKLQAPDRARSFTQTV